MTFAAFDVHEELLARAETATAAMTTPTATTDTL